MKKGFTLIELLVVIAIIAILAAILFPVFAQAREKARASSCLSNCKQIGTALMLYVDDYDETLPFYEDTSKPRLDGNDVAQHWKNDYPGYPITHLEFKLQGWAILDVESWCWADAVFPYVKNLNMFVCPSGQKGRFGYGYNVMLAGGYEHMDAGSQTVNPACLAQLKNSSELVFVADNVQYAGSYWVAGVTSPVLAYEAAVTGSGFVQPSRHNGGSNYTFCDGHAKYFKLHSGPSSVGAWSWGNGERYWDPAYYN
ncbi:MAG: DUF1559 domain-containing protein [Armatimonadetes bacterium]|nr:DUF1559 domain-containing protein [Candidatus Hippobium faecium]